MILSSNVDVCWDRDDAIIVFEMEMLILLR
jgi:hypothetical protein